MSLLETGCHSKWHATVVMDVAMLNHCLHGHHPVGLCINDWIFISIFYFPSLLIITDSVTKDWSNISQCTCPYPTMQHSGQKYAHFRTDMGTFMFWMVYSGIWDRCIPGFVRWYILLCILCVYFCINQHYRFLQYWSDCTYVQIKRKSKKASKFHVTGLCAGSSPAQWASKAENVSIWWRHHESSCIDKFRQHMVARHSTCIWCIWILRAVSFIGEVFLLHLCLIS